MAEERWKMNLGKSQRKEEGSPRPPRRAGQSRLDSLLSDDVIPWQGCAGHPSHLHVVGDLGEVQTQVHAVDGHSSSSFRWSRHRQNLWEGNGISKPVVHRSRGSKALRLLQGSSRTSMNTQDLGEESVFSSFQLV